MQEKCFICNQSCSIPFKVSCGHLYCFLCIKSNVLDGNLDCPVCKEPINSNFDSCNTLSVFGGGDAEKDIIENFFKDNSILWLYSSTFGERWWCYDEKCNLQIEMTYHDYLKRKRVMQEFDSDELFEQIDSPTDEKINKDGVVLSDFNFEFIQPDKIENIPVNFRSSLGNDVQERISKDSPEEVLSYSIKIGNHEYRLDFDNMKQVNSLDFRRQRRIKRIEIEPTIHNLKDYLHNAYGVLGVAGVKF